MRNPVLHEILASVNERRAERPVLLFDLDGTLYDNRPRTLRILHAFAAQLTREHAYEAELLHRLTAGDLSYRLEDTLSSRGISTSVISSASAAWRARFFTDAACADDVPLEGAVRFVRRAYELGATVVYFTGRDVPNMLLGTVRTLRDDGFPVCLPRVELVMKPTFEETDAGFKSRLLDSLDTLGAIVAGFDNEPANCNLFAQRWPQGRHVLLDTLRSPEAPALDPRCTSVKTFAL